MGRLLLSSGHVSLLLSAAVVFLFTLALFLSGYVLQQRYVHTLHAAIKPRLPKPLPPPVLVAPPTLDAKWARPGGGPAAIDDPPPLPADAHAHYVASQALDWSRLGYVQVVREHMELCSAVMLLADLARMKSPARRILLFPQRWLAAAADHTDDDNTTYGPELATTRRLLRTAARRYGITLLPMQPLVDGADDTLPSSYSLASLYSLVDYERLLYLQGPGVLLDASALDSLLAFSESAPMAAVPATPERKELSTSLLLLHPSQPSFAQLKTMRQRQPTSDVDLLRSVFSAPESLLSERSLSMGNVVYESQTLRQAGEGFNATAFEQATTFVRLADAGLPGPEYDVPFADRARVRPQNEQAQEAWSRLYERFRQRRMEVCGLDLETYRAVELARGDEL